MTAPVRPLLFAARSVAAGLALAFIVVMIRPDLVNLERRGPAAPPPTYSSAVAASSPAVVNIYTERVVGDIEGRTYRDHALGSGVVISAEGYVVTNWHVIAGADQVRVQLADGRIAVPALVGADPETELALLKIGLAELPVIRLGRSDELAVGDVVLAIGNSLGLSHTVTLGIVSATGRGDLGVTTFEDFVQTDAAINAGNSGGALINAHGELVGINTAISDRGSQAPPEGIGFAIPVNLVRGVTEQLIAHGRVIRGYLGVTPEELPPSLARRYGVDGWAVRVGVVQNPAAKAGIRVGDIVTHIDDQPITSARQAQTLIAGGKPGDRVRIGVLREGGEAYEAEVTLEDRGVLLGG